MIQKLASHEVKAQVTSNLSGRINCFHSLRANQCKYEGIPGGHFRFKNLAIIITKLYAIKWSLNDNKYKSSWGLIFKYKVLFEIFHSIMCFDVVVFTRKLMHNNVSNWFESQ